MINPNDVLPIGKVDDEELEAFLNSSFPRGKSRIDGMDHMDEGETIVLQVFYDANSQLDHVVAGSAWSDEVADQLKRGVRDNFETKQKLRVHRCVVFFLQPVTGWWRYKDQFQLLPVPANAPKPGQGYGLHPAILEISYLDAPNSMIQALRVRRALYKAQLMLATITTCGMSWQLDGGMDRKWVYITTAAPDIYSEYLQQGYYIPGFQPRVDEFTNVGDLSPIPLVDPHEYYKNRGIAMIDFQLPSTTSQYLDRFYSLHEPEQSQFLSAMYWYHLSGRSYEISKSLAYVSTINAIEAMSTEHAKDICPTCKKDRSPGPTAHFRDFLERYAPGNDTKADRNDLYSLRSKLIHGAQLMKDDLPTPWGSFRPSHLKEWDKRSHASSVVRIALLNWLDSHTT